MIDSVLLRHKNLPYLHLALSKFIQRHQRAFFRDNEAEYAPTLFYRRAPDGQSYFSIEVSLPKFFLGNNIQLLRKSELESALMLIGEYASRHFGVEFNALTAKVGRVDFSYNFQVGAERVYSYLQAAAEAEPLSLKRRIIGKIQTVEFFNKSRKLTLYDKFQEAQKQFAKKRISKELLETARGILRLEARFNSTEAVKSLAFNRFKLPDIQAQTILDYDVAKLILTSAAESLCLHKPIITRDARVDKLQQKYKYSSRLQRLTGFLTLCDIFGFDKLIELGVMKQSAYYRHRKEILDADALVFSDFYSKLSPLIIR